MHIFIQTWVSGQTIGGSMRNTNRKDLVKSVKASKRSTCAKNAVILCFFLLLIIALTGGTCRKMAYTVGFATTPYSSDEKKGTRQTQYIADDFFTSRYGSFDPNSNPKYCPRISSFSKGESVALVISGYSGRTVSVEIVNLQSGQNELIKDMGTGKWGKTQTAYIPEKQMGMFWEYPVVPPGSYKAYLKVNGVVVNSCNFTVYGE
jgi:hypothetical protein